MNPESFSWNTSYSNIISFKQLTFGQWANNSITLKPMYNMAKYFNSTEYANETIHSYSRLYPDLSALSKLDYTPEVHYYRSMAGLSGSVFQKSWSIESIIEAMNENYLYSPVLWNDAYLDVTKRFEGLFLGPEFRRYMRYTTY
jgi:hypothetical protein